SISAHARGYFSVTVHAMLGFCLVNSVLQLFSSMRVDHHRRPNNRRPPAFSFAAMGTGFDLLEHAAGKQIKRTHVKRKADCARDGSNISPTAFQTCSRKCGP